MKLRQLFEAPQKRTAVVAFGRMNPPTIGHQKLVQELKSHDGDHYVFLSQTQKPKTDPLAFRDKLRYAKFFFPEITIGHPDVRTPMDMMAMLQRLGYTDIIYVAGSDRVEGFKKLFNDYNGKPDKEGNIGYQFDSIEVVSAGERDPDADGAEGMSASKMRQAAADGNLEDFTNGTPRPEVADEMFNAVRKGMGIKELEPAESIDEDASPEQEYKFHKKLDKLVHDTFGMRPEEKKKKKDKETKEGNLVLDKSRLRSHIVSLIADKIAQTDDIEQLSQWLKLIVGKELKPRGDSKHRYIISAEDIVEAINMRMSEITEAADEGLPPTIKPLQIPPFPEMPQQDGDLGNGQTAGSFTKPFPGKYLSGGDGKFIWNDKGEPTEWHAPTFGGMSQRYNIKTGDITVRLQNGGLDISAVYDKTGKLKPGQGSASYDMGVAKVSKGPQGATVTDRGTGKTTQVDPNNPDSVKGALTAPKA